MDLQAIKDAADARYQPFPVKVDAKTTVHLLPPVKLEDTVRAEVLALLRDIDDEDNIRERIESVLIKVAETPTKGRTLVKALGGDLAYLTQTIREWTEAVKAGEASPSVS